MLGRGRKKKKKSRNVRIVSRPACEALMRGSEAVWRGGDCTNVRFSFDRGEVSSREREREQNRDCSNMFTTVFLFVPPRRVFFIPLTFVFLGFFFFSTLSQQEAALLP